MSSKWDLESTKERNGYYIEGYEHGYGDGYWAGSHDQKRGVADVGVFEKKLGRELTKIRGKEEDGKE